MDSNDMTTQLHELIEDFLLHVLQVCVIMTENDEPCWSLNSWETSSAGNDRQLVRLKYPWARLRRPLNGGRKRRSSTNMIMALSSTYSELLWTSIFERLAFARPPTQSLRSPPPSRRLSLS
ncbi:hypothetical protein NL676_008632 [Syzygium grande]|nr:hypothetical protein NL676_008632 [Syzygium grande]